MFNCNSHLNIRKDTLIVISNVYSRVQVVPTTVYGVSQSFARYESRFGAYAYQYHAVSKAINLSSTLFSFLLLWNAHLDASRHVSELTPVSDIIESCTMVLQTQKLVLRWWPQTLRRVNLPKHWHRRLWVRAFTFGLFYQDREINNTPIAINNTRHVNYYTLPKNNNTTNFKKAGWDCSDECPFRTTLNARIGRTPNLSPIQILQRKIRNVNTTNKNHHPDTPDKIISFIY